MVVRNFLTVYVLADQTPTGGKSRNTSIFGHFGLGLGEIPGLGRKWKIAIFRALGGPKLKKKLPRYPGWFPATFFHLTFRPTGPPWAGNRKIWGFQAILA